MTQIPTNKSVMGYTDDDERGQVIQEFGLNRVEVGRRIVLGIITIPMLVLLTDFFPPELKLNVETAIAVGIPLLVFVGWLLIFIPAIQALITRRKTRIYEGGVGRVSRTSEVYIPWTQLDGVQGAMTTHKTSGIPMYTSGAYTFFSDGKPIFKVFAVDADVEHLYTVLADRIRATHKDAMMERFKRNETLTFGRIHLQPDGLFIGKDFLPLVELGGVQFRGEYMVILRSNGRAWKEFMIKQVYNPLLLMDVLSTVLS